MVEGETETGSVEERESALLAAMGASEIYEYGFTLSNASYRCRSLSSMKMYRALRCEESGLIEEARGYVQELVSFVKNYRIKNPAFQNQLDQLQERLCDGQEDGKEKTGSILGSLVVGYGQGN